MTKRLLACTVFSLLVAGNTSAEGAEKARTPTSATGATKVALTCSKNLWCALPIVAEKRGIFDLHGLDVSLSYVQAAKFAMDALISASVDIAGVVDVNIAYLGFTGNQDIRLVTTVVHAHDGGIVARRSGGVTEPSDLAGKKVGVLLGTTSQIFADRFFQKHGLEGKTETVNLQPVAIQTAVVEGAISAGSIWQPLIFNVVKALREDALVFEDPDVYVGTMNMATRRQWAARHPGAIDDFVAALRDALKFVRENASQAQELLAKEIDLPRDTVETIWGQYEFSVDLDSTALTGEIERQGRWIIETQRGFSGKELPDYGVYFSAAASPRQQRH